MLQLLKEWLMGSNNELEQITYDGENMHERMLLLGEKFLEYKLTPVYFVDSKSNTTFILKFEKAEHGLH